ncbi:MAG: hypothetical protein ACFFDT_25155 [Candidatus Hodarchaeota archaeon]
MVLFVQCEKWNYVSSNIMYSMIQDHFKISDAPFQWVMQDSPSGTIEIRLSTDDLRKKCSYCGEEIELSIEKFTLRPDRNKMFHYFHDKGGCHPYSIIKNDPQWWEKYPFYYV